LPWRPGVTPAARLRRPRPRAPSPRARFRLG
jgi:hypothetical protein